MVELPVTLSGLFLRQEAKPTQVEVNAKAVVEKRQREAQTLQKEGKTLSNALEHFGNNYSPLAELYQEKTGVPLITDPYEAQEARVDIKKSCSIVIPAYNSGSQLKNTLLAIRASSFNAKYPQQLEVVVVDDGSPKVDIAQVVREIGLDDITVKVIRQANGRENKARYSGVLAASGDIVLFTSQDIVYTPTLIEEFMKRHQILDGIACFGFQNEVDGLDERLRPENIKSGSLAKLPYNFAEDFRVAEDGMADCDWLQKSGNNKPITIDNMRDWRWHLGAIAWGQCISAPRETLLKTIASTDDRYKGYGYDDENLVTDLIAEGLFVVPNTGGIAYHQRHPTRRNEEEQKVNKAVLLDRLNSPVIRQDPQNPRRTDAQVTFDGRNSRRFTKSFKRQHTDSYERAKTLMGMGIYDRAVELYKKDEKTRAGDVWFLHDYAVAMTNIGGRDNVVRAVGLLEKAATMSPNETWIQSSLAIAYGRVGRYDKCLAAYQKALKLNPNNWQAKLISDGEGNDLQKARELHKRGIENYLQRGKPKESLRYIEAAIALAGAEKVPWAVFDKGKSLYQLGDLRESIINFERARHLMPNETWVHSQLGAAYEKNGEKKKAENSYREALEQDSENSEAKAGLGRLSLGLYEWTKYDELSSQSLKKKDEALNERKEIDDYFERQSKEYVDRLQSLDAQINAPMKQDCRVVFTIPALNEGKIIRNTIENITKQVDFNGKPVNPDLYEIIILENHRADRLPDETEDMVRAFKRDNPAINVHYVHKIYDNDEPATVGNARKYVSDLSLSRCRQRESQTGDLIISSLDADIKGMEAHYLVNLIKDFDSSTKLDAVTGKWDLPIDALKKPNIKAAERFWYLLDRVIQLDAATEPRLREVRYPGLIGRNSAFRASIYAAIGGYNPNAKLAEDLEMGWRIRSARGWGDLSRCKFDNKLEIISDPRRYIAAIAQGTPLIRMYDDFHENEEIKKMDDAEVLKKIPDSFDSEQFENNVNAIFDSGKSKYGQYGWLGAEFDNAFNKVMNMMGLSLNRDYIIQEYEHADGTVSRKVRIINTKSLEKRLYQ